MCSYIMDFVIRRQSEQIDNELDGNSNSDDQYDYKKWEWGYLRTECENLELETFYNTYVQRLQRSYLSIFFVIHTFIEITHIIVIVATQKENTSISPEVYCYLASILIVWVALSGTFKEDLIRKYPVFPYVTSIITVIGLVLADMLVPLYHTIISNIQPPLRPAYASYILFTIYIFLPLSHNWHCIILSSATTIFYIIEMILITYRYDDDQLTKSFTELIFLFCVNIFGIYFRLMNEVAIRRAFLDRRECVEGNILLRTARDQEKDLLLSILPSHTAGALEQAIRQLIEKIRLEKRKAILQELQPKSLNITIPRKKWRGQAINKLYVEHHTDVTVLYADIVNYTFMTTQLPVKVLVETLHELFVKFDQASEEHNVLRIKFLGDCYYCVSGVPERNPYHAKSCVDLGLRMIRDIREIRAQKNNLNIDMRIGIHSGSIMAGVIGACKWQYDIWSKDASIANRLESTGVPGKVHISKQTLDMLCENYIYEIGTDAAKNDVLLQKNNIETYLISPQYFGEANFYVPDDNNIGRRFSSGVKKILTRNSRLGKTSKTEAKPSIRRNFMQNTMEQYMQIMKQTNLEMAQELDRMPIGKFHFSHIFGQHRSMRKRLTTTASATQYDNNPPSQRKRKSFSSNVSTIFMRFRDLRWEWSFMKEPDLMLKYSTLMGFVVFIGILVIQSTNSPVGNIYWTLCSISATILLIFIPITWFKKLWIVFNHATEEDPNTVNPPKNYFFKYLYNTSRDIMRNAVARFIIYLTMVALLTACSLIHLVECSQNDEMLLDEENFQSLCLNPWAITQSLILAICMSFLFVRIHFLLKFIVGLIIIGVYSWIIFIEFYFVYEQSPSINITLDAKYAHVLLIVFISIIFHMVDRQTEYIARVDYNWKQQLQRKQEEAECTKDTIKILVQNILPAHVAEIYMSRQIKDELYYEVYDNVAIMFATIVNYDFQNDNEALPIDSEKNVLSILNRIICDFDEQLLCHRGSVKIEKIKLAGWTYMVACGLDPGRGDSSASLTGGYRPAVNAHRSSLLSNGRRSWNNTRISSKQRASVNSNPMYTVKDSDKEVRTKPRPSQNVVYVLAEFALEIMRALNNFNLENFKSNGQLRIGISHGTLMAGVVGSSKPLYDVWGNAVNMASRMDSTGVPGKIQTTQETADVLQSFGIKCDYRGNTFVKGRGMIPTYFACMNEKFEFEKINGIQLSSSLPSLTSTTVIDQNILCTKL